MPEIAAKFTLLLIIIMYTIGKHNPVYFAIIINMIVTVDFLVNNLQRTREIPLRIRTR